MKKVLVLLAAYVGNLGASCTSGSQDPATQFAFDLCIAMFMNNPEIALEGASTYQASASLSNQIGTACTWCKTFVYGASDNSGGMTADFYDPYSSSYGNLTQINYQSLPAILAGAGVFTYINQGAAQKEAFVTCYVNQCGVRQTPQTTPVADCAAQCITLATQYLTWLAAQSIPASYMNSFKACAVNRGCWNSGVHAFGCFAPCAIAQTPFKPTAVPWIVSQ